MIARIGEDIERLGFNTAIAAMIEFTNTATAAATDDGPGILTIDQAERFAIACHHSRTWRKKCGPDSGIIILLPMNLADGRSGHAAR